MKNLYTKIRILFFFIFCVMCGLSASAQYTVVGPSPVSVGQTATYSCTKSSGSWASPAVWSAGGGTVISSYIDPSNKKVTYATIQWTSATDVNDDRYSSVAVSSGSSYGGANITVNCSSNPGVPSFSVAHGPVSGSKSCVPTTFTITASGGSGTNILWYYGASDLYYFTSGATFTTPTISTNTTYYIATVNTTTWCKSARVPVTLTMGDPEVPTFNVTHNSVSGNTFCASTTFNISATTGSGMTVRWYYNAGDTSPFYTGLSYTTPTISANTTYYISTYESYSPCESSKVPVNLYIIAPPTTPNFDVETFICTSGSSEITAWPNESGYQVKWYSASSGGSAFQTGGVYITPTLTSSTTYYITSFNPATGCESTPRTPITVVVYTPPASPSVSNQSICGASAVTLTATPGAGGVGINWYNSANSYLGSGTSISASVSATTTFYARSVNQACESASAPVTITVNTIPVAPPYDPFTTFAYGHGSVTLSANVSSGNSVYWYSSASGGSPLAVAHDFNTPDLSSATTYYAASQSSPTCAYGVRLAVVADIRPIPSSYKTTVDRVRVSGATDDAGINALTSAQRVTQVTHFDGLLRTVEQIAVKASPAGKDLVQAVDYDNTGTSTKTYLPYVATTTDGSFHPSYVTEQSGFYTATSDKIVNDDYPFTVLKSEDSPLGRSLEQGTPGAAWQIGSGHTQKINYSYNTGSEDSEAEEVRRFDADGSSADFYAANTLSRTEGTDEDGHKVITFTDGAGNTIVQKKQLDEVIGGVTVNYLQTYYVYDDFGRVHDIISPKGTAALRADGWDFTGDIRDNYCNQFLYDDFGRLIEKKTPGQAPMYYVYDKMDRLVLAQDGLLRASNKWMFVKYDIKDRAFMQGIYTNTTQTTRATVQTLVDGLYLSGNLIYPETAKFEDRGTTLHGYTNVSFPKANSDDSPIVVLNVNYYESYDFDYNGTREYKYDSTTFSGQATWSDYRAKDRATGSKRLILGTSLWLYTYVFYDDHGNPIQVRTNNHLSSTVDNLVTNVFDFEGKMNSSKKYHHAGPGKQTTVISRYDYDVQGRIKKIYQNNNGAASDQLVAAYDYNELGQLVDKKLHGNDPVTPTAYLQSVDYRFDIRGKLLSINNAALNTDSNNDDPDSGDDYFGMELAYNTSAGMGNTARYDGNISAMTWKGAGALPGSTDKKSYTYDYDKSGKLKGASSQMYTGSAWTKEANALNEAMTYDENGNIQTLQRNQRKHQLTGLLASYTAETSDDLDYAYNSTIGDRLEKVTDAATPVVPGGFDNGSSSTSTDYTYDANGNVLSDLNKGISGITYNVLGKPDVVNFTDGRKVEYAYDAGGNKLMMISYLASDTLITDYVDGFVYENDTLRYFGSPEGRVVAKEDDFEYQYAIADHQGNTRVVFSSNTPGPKEYLATFEDVDKDAKEFLNIPKSLPYLASFTAANHTTSGMKVARMNQNTPIGPSKNLAVYPGDKVDMNVWAYYEDNSGFGTSSPSLTPFVMAIAGSFGGASGAGGESGAIYSGVNNAVTAFGVGGNQGDSQPGAYLNYILFDRNYKVLDMGFTLVPTSARNAKQNISIPTIDIKEPGYIFVYLSYEDESDNYVEFDDFSVTHTQTNIIQYNEYYPFGLQASTSWTRENSSNNYLYNGPTETNNTTGLIETMFRGYDPALGRFMQVDPLAHTDVFNSSYNYSGNNPIRFNDPSGLKFGSPQWLIDLFSGMEDQAPGNAASEGGNTRGYHYDRSMQTAYDLEAAKDGRMSKEDYVQKYGQSAVNREGEVYNPWENTYVPSAEILSYNGGGSQVDWYRRLAEIAEETGNETMLSTLTVVTTLSEGVSATAVTGLGMMALAGTVLQGDAAKKEPKFTYLYRNVSLTELSSYVRKGFNFGIPYGGFNAKQFWMTPDGLSAWNRSNLAGPFVITVAIPTSIIGPIVQPQMLDGHLAGVVYSNNLNAFNSAKVTFSITKAR